VPGDRVPHRIAKAVERLRRDCDQPLQIEDIAHELGLKLPPAEQAALVMLDPATFSAGPGTWGEPGSTYVQLHTVEPTAFQAALKTAWRGVVPRRLLVIEE
jgi:hypothetical protein